MGVSIISIVCSGNDTGDGVVSNVAKNQTYREMYVIK